MSIEAVDHHRKAAEHFEYAVKHHTEVGNHYGAGRRRVDTAHPYCLCGARWEAIFTTCVWSSVSQASTPLASASERPSLIAASCVGDIACGALGMTLISCSRTALGCETRTSPDFTFDNDSGLVLFDTVPVWATLAIRDVPFGT